MVAIKPELSKLLIELSKSSPRLLKILLSNFEFIDLLEPTDRLSYSIERINTSSSVNPQVTETDLSSIYLNFFGVVYFSKKKMKDY